MSQLLWLFPPSPYSDIFQSTVESEHKEEEVGQLEPSLETQKRSHQVTAGPATSRWRSVFPLEGLLYVRLILSWFMISS